MCANIPYNTQQALSRVFFEVRQQSFGYGVRTRANAYGLRGVQSRSFTKPSKSGKSSRSSKSNKSSKNPAHREVRQELWNNEIPALWVQLVDPVTKLLQPPASRWKTVNDLDQKVQRLIQLGEAESSQDGKKIAICKIVNIEQAFKEERARRAKSDAIRKVSMVENDVKTLELNWAIDKNDLQHRISKAKGFLEAGRQVEFVLAPKKRGRQATEEECQQLIKDITKAVDTVDGVRLAKPMDGKLGRVAMLHFKGRPMDSKGAAQA